MKKIRLILILAGGAFVGITLSQRSLHKMDSALSSSGVLVERMAYEARWLSSGGPSMTTNADGFQPLPLEGMIKPGALSKRTVSAREQSKDVGVDRGSVYGGEVDLAGPSLSEKEDEHAQLYSLLQRASDRGFPGNGSETQSVILGGGDKVGKATLTKTFGVSLSSVRPQGISKTGATESSDSVPGADSGAKDTTIFSDTGVRVDIPADVSVKSVSIRALGDAPGEPDGLAGIGLAFQFEPEDALFRSPLRITFPYSEEDLQAAGISHAGDLRILYFDPQRNVWSEEGIKVLHVDAANRRVIAEISHFSIFRIFAPKEKKSGRKQPPPPSKDPETGTIPLPAFLATVWEDASPELLLLFKQNWASDSIGHGTIESATLEGNALTLLMLAGPAFQDYQALARRLADSLLHLQSKDPSHDGRLRNVYNLTALKRGGVVGSAILDMGSSPRSLALATLGLIQAAKMTQEERFKVGAIRLASFLQNFRDRGGAGYFDSLGENTILLEHPAKRTVDNLIMYVAFLRLYDLTLDNIWWDAASSAKEYVEGQWQGTHYKEGDAGTSDAPDAWSQSVDNPNSWAILAFGEDLRSTPILDWSKEHLALETQVGLGMDSNLDRDGVSTEATLRFALSLALLRKASEPYLASILIEKNGSDSRESLFPLDGSRVGVTFDIGKFGREERDLSCAIWLYAVSKRWNLLWGEAIDEGVPRQDDIAPYLRIQEPTNDVLLRTPVIQVRGKAHPMNMAVTVNGFGTRREKEEFFLDRLVLGVKGTNILTAMATTKDGRHVTDEVVVQFEPLAPTSPKIRIETVSSGKQGLVELSVEAQGATEMKIGEDVRGATWEPYQARTIYLLSRGDGLKTVYAQFRNEFLEKSAIVSASILFDTTAPSGVSFTIKEGIFTVGPEIHLELVGSDAAFFQVSHEANVTDWLPLQGTFALRLSQGEGEKVVNVRFRDVAGNTTAYISQTIYLYENKPSRLPVTRWIRVSSNPPEVGKPLEIRAKISTPVTSPVPVKTALCVLQADGAIPDIELPMQPEDGSFDSAEEIVVVSIPQEVLSGGLFKIVVKGSDVFDQWGEGMVIRLDPTPLDVMETIQNNYKRLKDIKTRLETDVHFPDGASEGSTRTFILKFPDKMKTISSNGEEIMILKGAILTTKAPEMTTGSIDLAQNSELSFSGVNWFSNLRDEDDGVLNNNGFLDHHEIRFTEKKGGEADNDPNLFVVETIPLDFSKAQYSSIVFRVDYSKGIETEVSYFLGEKLISRMRHEQIEWIGDVAWFGTRDIKIIPLGDFGDLRHSEVYKDIQVNTGIPDSEFEM